MKKSDGAGALSITFGSKEVPSTAEESASPAPRSSDSSGEDEPSPDEQNHAPLPSEPAHRVSVTDGDPAVRSRLRRSAVALHRFKIKQDGEAPLASVPFLPSARRPVVVRVRRRLKGGSDNVKRSAPTNTVSVHGITDFGFGMLA